MQKCVSALQTGHAPGLAGAASLSGVAATAPPASSRAGCGASPRLPDVAGRESDAAAIDDAVAGEPLSEAAADALGGGVAATQLEDSPSSSACGHATSTK